MPNDFLQLLKETNDRDHAEIKDELKWIRKTLAPHVFANRKAVVIILGILAATGIYKAVGAF